MDKADALLGALASGDIEGKNNEQSGLRREQDSVDDFEHLEGEAPKRDEFSDSPIHQPNAGIASQNFLDTEREDIFVQPPSVPAPAIENLTDKNIDHMADKFTDSESEASAGESPMHRAVPKAEPTLPAVAETPKAPTESTYRDPTPILAPTSTGSSVPETAPVTSVPAPSAPAPSAPTPAPSAPPPLAPAPSAPTPSAPAPSTTGPSTPAPAPTPVAAPIPKPDPEPAATPVIKPDPVPVPTKEEPVPAPKPAPVKREPSPPPATATRAPSAHVIEAEVIFCQMGLDAWFDPQRLHPKVESLIYWRDPARSGAALGAGLALLVALACCSVVSVFAYVSLLGLSAAVAFRIYKNVLQAVQKTNEGHPFKWMLEKDISVPAERAQSLAAGATAHLNATTNELRRLFLVEDLVDSLKFGVVLWCLTYVGAYFNGITLIILGWIALFTLPKAYEMNKAQVDANLELARGKINEISAKVRAAVPLGKKSESEKDK